MRLKLSHPLSISPKIALEPLGQLVTNLAAGHKSQIHHVPAHLIKAHTLGETSSCGDVLFTESFRASLSWVLWVLSRHHQLPADTECAGCYDPNGWTSWVAPAMVPPRHSGAANHDSEEGYISSFLPRALSARPRGRAGWGMPLMPPTLAAALPSRTSHVLLLFSHHLVTNLPPRKAHQQFSEGLGRVFFN